MSCGEKKKVQWYKEQYCIGTWNVRSMKQGKLDKQEMARVNINILGISEWKWTGINEFNSYDHYICYCGQKSLRRNGVAFIVNNSSKCSTWVQPQKQQNDLISFSRKTIQHQNVQVYAATTNAEDVKTDWFYEDLKHLLELTPKKKILLFLIGDWNTKVGSQEIPRITGKLTLEYRMKQEKR